MGTVLNGRAIHSSLRQLQRSDYLMARGAQVSEMLPRKFLDCERGFDPEDVD
jgi:hypothetical protein